MSSTFHHAARAWLPQGFAADVRFGLDATGAVLRTIDTDREGDDAPVLGRFVVPGMANLHSHAFQRAMAGLAERRENPDDTFWSWREVMYAFAGRVGPDDLRAIAAQLYVEMLEAGYTQVCEFHYLHHQPDGTPYADPAAMSLALVEAARETGIGLTLLPTLYMTGGFDGRALSPRQQRFRHDVDGFLRLVERLRAFETPRFNVGIALHSLRAVQPDAMRAVLAGIAALPPSPAQRAASTMPVHIHVAEQIGEVEDCLAIRNARPVEWLLDNAPVDRRWCLVHATHLEEREMRRLAASGAVAGLCPTPEANLGDGLVPLKAYLDAGGALGIGSDSHISVSPVEELRWLEYGQRLVTRHRNVSASTATPSTGELLFARALAGGAQAAGGGIGAFEPGRRADFVVLDDDAALFAGRDPAQLIDTWLFAGNVNLVRDVFVGGERVVEGGRHREHVRVAQRYRDVVERLARNL